MHHDFFACVRLILFFILILACAFWLSSQDQTEQESPIPVARAATIATTPTEAEAATEPTFSEPAEETTPPTEAATIATEPPAEPEFETIDAEAAAIARDLELLAIVIYNEAGGDNCDDFTRLGVGTVAMNRVADPRFPDTLHKVLTQEAQYGTMDRTGVVWPERASDPNEAHAVERARIIAERILLEGVRVFDADVVFQAEFPQGTEVVAYSDGMYFCR